MGFCSKQCSAIYSNSHRNTDFGKKTVTCPRCGDSFEADKRVSATAMCGTCKVERRREREAAFRRRHRPPSKRNREYRPKRILTYEEEVQEKFLNRIEKTEAGCWLWLGSKSSEGYGQVTIQGKTIGTHRFAYKYFNGEDPGNLFICHECDNPPCVNPLHLWIGTPSDNVQDMLAKGRAPHQKKIL